MAVQAAVTRYKEEMIAGFERRTSDLMVATTREMMSSGLSVVFLVTSSGGAHAVTRGQNGDIPYNAPGNTQVTVTLTEAHAPFSLTGFDIFASQGSQTTNMQQSAWATIRRAQDDVIVAELANATQDQAAASGFNLGVVANALAALGNNNVPIGEADQMFGLLSPAAFGYLIQQTEFTNGDYVDVKPLSGGMVRKMYRWAGVNWIMSSAVGGLGTSTELLYIWHRSAIGYACNVGDAKFAAGFNEEQQRSWAIATVFHAAKIIQNAGIIKITHDASNIGATT